MLDDLLVSLGFDYDDEAVKRFNDGYNVVNQTINKLALVATGAAVALTGVVVATSASADETGKLAAEIGETTDAIDALMFAQERTGGDAGAMVSGLRALSKNASETARGVGSAVESFGLLGISVHGTNGEIKSASTLITEVAAAMAGMERGRQIDLAEKLGLGSSIRLLQQGADEIRNLTSEARELGVTTQRDAELASSFNDALTNVNVITGQLSRSITAALSPTLTKLTASFVNWWKANREVIEQNLPYYIEKLTNAFLILVASAAAFVAVKLGGAFVSLLSLIRATTLATMLMNAAVLMLPALLVGGVALLVALIDDARVFFEGGSSFIGDMIAKFPALESKIRIFAELLRGVYTIGSMIKDGWTAIFDMFRSFSFDGLKEVLGNMPGFLGDLLGLTDAKDTMINNIVVPAREKLGSGVTGDTTTNSTSENRIDNITINVNGTTSPDETALEIQRAFEQATLDLFNPVDR